MKRILCLSLLLVATPVHAQRSVVLTDPGPELTAPLPTWPQAQQLPPPGTKSPGLAAVLSLVIPYGTGSFYAGNEGHGVRHLVLGLGSVVGMVGGLAAACDDGFTFCDTESAGFYVAGAFATLWLTNWVWGIFSAVGDAKTYNRALLEQYQARDRVQQEDPGPRDECELIRGIWRPVSCPDPPRRDGR